MDNKEEENLNKEILDIEKNIDSSIRLLNFDSSCSSSSSSSNFVVKNKDKIAAYIHNNKLDLENNLDEMNTLILKILSPTEKKARLVLFELEEYIMPENLNIDNFKLYSNKVISLVNKYTRDCFSIILLEDKSWQRIDISREKEDVLTLKNSMLICDQEDLNSIKFLKSMINRINSI